MKRIWKVFTHPWTGTLLLCGAAISMWVRTDQECGGGLQWWWVLIPFAAFLVLWAYLTWTIKRGGR